MDDDAAPAETMRRTQGDAQFQQVKSQHDRLQTRECVYTIAWDSARNQHLHAPVASDLASTDDSWQRCSVANRGCVARALRHGFRRR